MDINKIDPSDFLKKMKMMPDNWWRMQKVAKGLFDWFSRYMVGLAMIVEINNKKQHTVYSGFLLFQREILFWVTAGHVIEEIQELISNENVKIIRQRWLDGCDIKGAGSIPVHGELNMFSILKETGIDFGVVALSLFDMKNICKNKNVEIMTEQIWKNSENAHPEGYYVLGFPYEWIEVNEKQTHNNITLGSIFAGYACVPIEKIDYSEYKKDDDFWDDPNAFYGRKLPFNEGSEFIPEDMKGMSGGPVISIERDYKNVGIRYRLFGIQRGQNKFNKQFIRVEPSSRVLSLIK